MHLRQQLAARDMALTARAGVAEMKLDLPSSEHRMRALEMEKTKGAACFFSLPLDPFFNISLFLNRESTETDQILVRRQTSHAGFSPERGASQIRQDSRSLLTCSSNSAV
jgi:hypothetical protein